MSVKLDRRAFLSTALTFGALCALDPTRALGVTSAEKQAEVQSIKAQLDSMNEELVLATDQYNLANRSYEEAMQRVQECQAKIDAAQDQINSLQARISTRATSMYRSGSMSYLDVLLGVGSFDDFATVWDTLNHLNEDDADLVAETRVAKAELESAKADLDEQQAEAESQLAAAQSYQAQIEARTAEYEALYNSLSAEYQQLLAEEEEARLAAEAAAASAYFPSSSSSSSSSSAASSKTYSAEGGTDAVSRAYSCLGLPYVYGSAGPGCYDCSGLVSYALTGRHSHVYVSQDFWALSAVSDPQPGDVVACSAGHCGLYIGNGQMIEAPHTGAVVRISSVRGKIVRP